MSADRTSTAASSCRRHPSSIASRRAALPDATTTRLDAFLHVAGAPSHRSAAGLAGPPAIHARPLNLMSPAALGRLLVGWRPAARPTAKLASLSAKVTLEVAHALDEEFEAVAVDGNCSLGSGSPGKKRQQPFEGVRLQPLVLRCAFRHASSSTPRSPSRRSGLWWAPATSSRPGYTVRA